MNQNNDTICAVATPAGGAISLIRISGPEAISIADRIFTPASGKPLRERKPYSLCYGQIMDDQDTILDDVVASIFRAPHSYTGEDSIELSCHGSIYIAQQIVALLIMNGCRQACPGEFTQRAFLSGKMDLSQAEAVADLIASTSAASHRLAMNQMKGGFSRKLRELRDKLLELTSLMELELDFSEENVEFADRTHLDSLAAAIEGTLTTLSDSFKTGDAIRNGIPVAIIGRTNTGKSPLLNLLLNDDKAIVSDIQGTTRDSIEDTVTIGGTLFRLTDTAGIRQSDDTIEQLGIERSFRKASAADIIIYLTDCSQPTTENDLELADRLHSLSSAKTLIRVHNKCDLLPDIPVPVVYTDHPNPASNHVEHEIYISAKQEINIDNLKHILLHSAETHLSTNNDVIVTNMRHFEAISHALDCIRRARSGITSNLPTDLLSQDTRECIHHLSDILGEVTTDQVLQNIFSHFCIGK